MNMREEFEKWYRDADGSGEGDIFKLDEDGEYYFLGVRLGWRTWQAAQPRWIKCSEPPENSRFILLADSNGCIWTGIYSRTSGFILDIGCNGDAKVTHWMPLPEAPGEPED